MTEDKQMKMALAIVQFREILEGFMAPNADHDALKKRMNSIVSELGEAGFTKEEVKGIGAVATGQRSDLPGVPGSAVIITRK